MIIHSNSNIAKLVYSLMWWLKYSLKQFMHFLLTIFKKRKFPSKINGPH